jgi:hypothetical protein
VVVFPSVTQLTAVRAVEIEIKDINFSSLNKTSRDWL